MSETPQRLIIGISGGSGVILGVRLLEVLAREVRDPEQRERHLVVTEAGRQVLMQETNRDVDSLSTLVTRVHRNDDISAPISSGSFPVSAMVVVPCSMKTLAGVASGFSDNLILRAADVCLKERRRLVLVTRETPLNLIHLENMRRATLAGAVILPPVLSMYSRPQKLEDAIDQIVGKILDVLGIDFLGFRRWS